MKARRWKTCVVNAKSLVAASAFVGATETKTVIDRVTRKKLDRMDVGETAVFTEPTSTRSAGAACQCYASRCGIKIKTTLCYVVLPTKDELIKAICVTRTG